MVVSMDHDPRDFHVMTSLRLNMWPRACGFAKSDQQVTAVQGKMKPLCFNHAINPMFAAK